MLTTLILAAALGQTVGVSQQAPRVVLSAAQRTALGNHLTARWPSATLSAVMAFDCSRDRISDADGNPAVRVSCSPTVSEPMTAARVFALLLSGASVTPGAASGDQQRQLGGRVYTGSSLTALADFCALLWPSATGVYTSLHCEREGSGVACSATYCAQMTQAQAYAALQAGQSLAPCQ